MLFGGAARNSHGATVFLACCRAGGPGRAGKPRRSVGVALGPRVSPLPSVLYFADDWHFVDSVELQLQSLSLLKLTCEV